MADEMDARVVADRIAERIWSVGSATERFAALYADPDRAERAKRAGAFRLFYEILFESLRDAMILGVSDLFAPETKNESHPNSLFHFAEALGDQMPDEEFLALTALKRDWQHVLATFTPVLAHWKVEDLFREEGGYHAAVSAFRGVLQKIGAWVNSVLTRYLAMEECDFSLEPDDCVAVDAAIDAFEITGGWRQLESEMESSPWRAGFGQWVRSDAKAETVAFLETHFPKLLAPAAKSD